MFSVFTEDLSKSDDKEDIKKEGEEGKGAKKADDPEVSCIHIRYCCLIRLTSVVTLSLTFQFFNNLKLTSFTF